MNISRLDKTHYNKEIVYEYVTTGHYKATVKMTNTSFTFDFVHETFETPITKSFTDILVPDYLEHPAAFGIFVKDVLIACIVLEHETYNNRLRIVQLLVQNEYRHQGIGKALMQHALDYAHNIKARAIVLETQSCNEPAIRFYVSCGYHFIGCDVISYTNNDIENNEIRIEMGKMIEQP